MRLARLTSVTISSFKYPSNKLAYLKNFQLLELVSWRSESYSLSPLRWLPVKLWGGWRVYPASNHPLRPHRPRSRLQQRHLEPNYPSKGTGRGCVTTGPFANWTVRFGPIGPNLTDSMRNNLIKYKPHCLSRSFKPKFAAFSFTQFSLGAILQSPNIIEFNKRLIFIINPTIPTILNLHGKDHQGMSCIYSINQNSQLPHNVNFLFFF